MERCDGDWSAQVQWRHAAGETFIDAFPVERIRPDRTELPGTRPPVVRYQLVQSLA